MAVDGILVPTSGTVEVVTVCCIGMARLVFRTGLRRYESSGALTPRRTLQTAQLTKTV